MFFNSSLVVYFITTIKVPSENHLTMLLGISMIFFKQIIILISNSYNYCITFEILCFDQYNIVYCDKIILCLKGK